jgi:oligoribonuclease NrnB/cAMP/cGMP phosphodiesterase (DHH superfamily)
MKQIPIDANILSIAHNDLDGSVSQIILGHIFKNIKYIHCSFYKIDDILLSLDFSKYDYVFLTDIHPDNHKNLLLSNKIILIDHHKSAENYNNPSKGHFVIPDKKVCASVLTKTFVEKMYNIKLTDLDSIVYLTNDYDMWNLKNSKSKLLNDVMFYLYRPAKFRELFFNGRTRFTQYEIEWLRKRRKIFKDLYANLSVFEFQKINGCIAESHEFINEICHKLMTEEKYNIVFIRNTTNQRVSVRHNIKGLDIGSLLKTKGYGGGHEMAAGFWTSDSKDFEIKIKTLENDINNMINIQ